MPHGAAPRPGGRSRQEEHRARHTQADVLRLADVHRSLRADVRPSRPAVLRSTARPGRTAVSRMARSGLAAVAAAEDGARALPAEAGSHTMKTGREGSPP